MRLHTLRLSNYEIVDVPDGGGVETGTEIRSASSEKEPVENSMKHIERPPPRRPPRTFKSVSSMEEIADESIYQNIVQYPTRKQTKALGRPFSEPGPLTSTGATGSSTDVAEHYYAKVKDSAHELYSSDLQIQVEVKNLMESHDWCYVYNNRQEAEEKLSDKNSPDGSFAVICEDIEENHHYPFTLLLKYREKVTRTPIKKVQENRGKRKYELLNVKKDSVEKLIKHFKEKQLPDYKLKLL